MSYSHQYHYSKGHEIYVGNISKYTEQHALIDYFTNFGSVLQYNFGSPSGRYVFIMYKDRSMVDCCLNARPHCLNGRTLYVKRALPIDDDHPRERFVTTNQLMIVIDSNAKTHRDPQFTSELQEYFATYGRLNACKYLQENSFDYILIEFADEDQVDRIILDKPHYYRDDELNVMKHIPSNIEIQNRRYSSNNQQPTTVKDAIADDTHDHMEKNNSITTDRLSEFDLEKEVFRLQNILKNMNDDFALQRRELELECSDQLKKLQKNTEQTFCLRQDLEREHAKLLVQYEEIKNEKETLSEQYLTAELENFEITSYFEQIMAEERAKTVELQSEYQQKLEVSRTHTKHPSASSISSPASTGNSSQQTTANTN